MNRPTKILLVHDDTTALDCVKDASTADIWTADLVITETGRILKDRYNMGLPSFFKGGTKKDPLPKYRSIDDQ